MKIDKAFLLRNGWVDKGDILVMFSNPRVGWKPESSELVIGWHRWHEPVVYVKSLKQILNQFNLNVYAKRNCLTS